MDINRINPYIRRAIPSVLLPGLELKQRIIFDYELVYVESGDLTISCAGKEYDCREGDFLFFRPGIPHSFHRLRRGSPSPTSILIWSGRKTVNRSGSPSKIIRSSPGRSGP